MSNLHVPWPLLLASLRQSDHAVLSFAAVAHAGGDADALVTRGLADFGGADAYSPPLCRHGALPNLDFQRRRDEGLVGVACPVDPACWPGWIWVARSEVTVLRPRLTAVLAALAHRNSLAPMGTAVEPPFTAVGLLRQRGLRLPVVWLRAAPPGFVLLCKALRATLGGDGLIVLVAKLPPPCFAASDRICVIEVPCSADGDLCLLRALEELHPGYREQALVDPTLDFDHIRLRLDSHQGLRHIVQINGHDVGGFRSSDVKFARLLLLAVARKQGANDGWVPKHVLCDDDPKGHAIEKLRNELGTYHVPGLGEPELRALVRCHRGGVRLALPPAHIDIDVPLDALRFVGPAAQPPAAGARPRVTARQRQGLQNAKSLLRTCQEMMTSG
ncbi:MAG: hypothetical protein IPI49_19605 [Myxococcales bacterium]|nr:hypothetical protein [Myxococcales bacterium]